MDFLALQLHYDRYSGWYWTLAIGLNILILWSICRNGKFRFSTEKLRYQERSILRWCLWTSFGLIIFYAEIVVIEAVWPSTITKIILAIATAVFAVIFVFIAAILQDRVRHCCIFDSTADKNSRNVHSKSFFHKLKHAFAARDADLKEICAFQIAQLEDPDTFLRYNKNYNDFKEYQGRKKTFQDFEKMVQRYRFARKNDLIHL